MTARLRSLKTLDGFDFSFQPSLDRNRILALAELAFIARKEIVHLLGPPGLLHHAQVVQIEGSSYRLREHAALVPENLKARYAGSLANQQPRRRGRPRKEPQPQ